MDGYQGYLDNVWIERFWRTIKREYIYLSPEYNGTDLYYGIDKFIRHYNTGRPHQGINNKTPKNVYNMYYQRVA